MDNDGRVCEVCLAFARWTLLRSRLDPDKQCLREFSRSAAPSQQSVTPKTLLVPCAPSADDNRPYERLGAPWSTGALGPGPPGPLDKRALLLRIRVTKRVSFRVRLVVG